MVYITLKCFNSLYSAFHSESELDCQNAPRSLFIKASFPKPQHRGNLTETNSHNSGTFSTHTHTKTLTINFYRCRGASVSFRPLTISSTNGGLTQSVIGSAPLIHRFASKVILIKPDTSIPLFRPFTIFLHCPPSTHLAFAMHAFLISSNTSYNVCLLPFYIPPHTCAIL